MKRRTKRCGLPAVLLGGLETWFVIPMMIINLMLFFTGRAAMVTFCTGTAIVTALRPRSPIPWGVFPSLVLGVVLLWMFDVQIGMPAKEIGAENSNKPAQLNPAETRDVAAYIASLAGGPAIPTPAEVSTSGANVGLGQQLFTADCAQCHNFDGAGGALTDGKYAPPLTQATPTQMYEAMLTGPEAMPVFNNTTITPSEKRDIIAYVTSTRVLPNPGGFSLGRIGPVTEGLVAFLGLLFFMVLSAMWITAKHRKTADE